jgi:hypothetical protein
VISIQNMQCAPSLGGFFGQAGEQIKNVLFVVTTVQLVASLDHYKLAADPVIPVIDCACELQGPARRLEIAVQITDRHDAGLSGAAQGYLIAGQSCIGQPAKAR